MFERYKEDIQCFMEHDPAARSPIEIVLLYPGFKALRSHRKAQWFLNHKMPFIARYISQRTAHKTGIEIHPGAKIGRRVCIDHGNGIVIGETTEVRRCDDLPGGDPGWYRQGPGQAPPYH